MSRIKYAIWVIISDIYLILKKVTFSKVSFSLISLVSPRTIIRALKGKIEFGKKVCIRSNSELAVSCGGMIKIGENCFINRNCMIISHESIVVGSGSTIGPNVCIYDHDHDGLGGYISAPITIGENVWIGAGVIILKGVVVGKNSTIAAGSVITKDVPENTIVYQRRENVYRSKKK